MTSSYAQLRKDAPRLVAMHANLIKPGAAMWRKAEAERQHFMTIEERLTRLERTLSLCCPQATKASRIEIVEIVQNIVCDELKITKAAMLQEDRAADLVWARHLAMDLARGFSDMPTPDLAKLFHRLDHTTILHACKRVKKARVVDRAKALQYDTAKARILQAFEICKAE